MSGLFKKVFKKSSNKHSTSASPRTSGELGATPSSLVAEDTEGLGLVVAPIVASSSKDKNSGSKELCMAYGTKALELLKEISAVNGALAPLGAICGATLNILKTIEAMGSNEEGWKTLLETIQRHHTIFTQQLKSTDQDKQSTSLDPRLQSSINAYSIDLHLILVAVMQESGTVRDQARGDTKAQKLITFVKEYGAVDIRASAINEYTKRLDDSMKEFQASITLRTAITVDQINNTTQQILSTLRSEPVLTSMPELRPRPSLTQDFVGRQDILDAMRLTHVDNRSTELQTPAITVLYGLGGSGKTQIALKFALELEQKYSDKRVFFLNASSEDSVKADLEIIIRSSEKAQPSGSYQDTLTWLASKFKDWLLILDNADDPSVRIFQYIPKCTHGDVIVTTRNSNHVRLARHSGHSVEGLSSKDAISLILTMSNYENSEVNRELAHPIVTRLGCMALAVAQAGGYIFVNKCLSSYLDMYEKNQADFLESEEMELPQDYSFTVATTVRMSLEKLPSDAQELMQLFAHLDSTSIPYDVIARSASRRFCSVVRTDKAEMDPKTLELAGALTTIFCSDGEWSEFNFTKLVTKCLQYSLLRLTIQGDAKFYSMHILVQSYLQTQGSLIRGHRPSLLVVRLLGSSLSQGARYEHMAFYRQLASHVRLLNPQDITEPGDHFGFGEVLSDVGDYKLSIIHQKRCVDMWSSSCKGPEHQDTLTSMIVLANSYNAAGQLQEALKLREEALKLQKRVFGLEHPNTLISMNNLAISYNAVGRLQEALKLREEVLEWRKRLLGPEHPQTLTSMNNLASSYNAVDRRQEALKLWEEVLQLQRRVLGLEHPHTLLSMNNLAVSYDTAGRKQEALKLREEALESRKRVLGMEHPQTLISMHNLAISYDTVGRRQEVLKLQEEVLELQKKVLGLEHPDTLASMNNLAISYDAVGRLQEALRLREEVLESRKMVLGPEHLDTLTSMNDLAFSYDADGRTQEALKLRGAISAMRMQAPGSE